MLEVIDKGAVSEAHPAPLLFVHGAWHAAWCWDEYFLSYFADKGLRAAYGHDVQPEDLSRWDLPDDSVKALEAAYADLLKALPPAITAPTAISIRGPNRSTRCA